MNDIVQLLFTTKFTKSTLQNQDNTPQKGRKQETTNADIQLSESSNSKSFVKLQNMNDSEKYLLLNILSNLLVSHGQNSVD